MKIINDYLLSQTRRQFFGHGALRMGGVSMALMAAQRAATAQETAAVERVHPPLPGFPHFAPKAKSIIYLHMNGGPSQLDTWDYKAHLADHFDKDLPDSIRMGQRITTMTSGQARLPVAPSLFKFARYGQAGPGSANC